MNLNCKRRILILFQIMHKFPALKADERLNDFTHSLFGLRSCLTFKNEEEVSLLDLPPRRPLRRRRQKRCLIRVKRFVVCRHLFLLSRTDADAVSTIWPPTPEQTSLYEQSVKAAPTLGNPIWACKWEIQIISTGRAKPQCSTLSWLLINDSAIMADSVLIVGRVGARLEAKVFSIMFMNQLDWGHD